MRLFNWMEIETSSLCNRQCPMCIRNSHPERELVAPWFEQTWLPMETIQQVLEQAADLGFQGRLCLAHFNEPLLDSRLEGIVRFAKSFNGVWVYTITNGDLLTRDLAKRIDGMLDRIVVSLYETDVVKRAERKAQIRQMFLETQVVFKGAHTITHFAPGSEDLIRKTKDLSCTGYNRRLVINHRGQYLLCCEDIHGAFGFGRFPETSLKDYWYGAKRAQVIADLQKPGGRANHPYCLICPR